MAAIAEFRTVGRPVPRVEGPDKVTGRALYTADVALPGMLWGANVLSPHPHARIVSVDTSRAQRVPGVRAVLTGRDVAGVRIGRHLKDQPVLCGERVRFVGDKVAAVAAEDPGAAEEAALLVEVEYEELAAVFDPLEAMQARAPLIHPEARFYRGFEERIPEGIPNVCGYRVHERGDVVSGMAAADTVIEHTFTTSLTHQGYLEPHTSVVAIFPSPSPPPPVGARERIQIWASNKTPYNMRKEFADATGLSEADIVIRPVTVGGDFGSKGGPGDAVTAYHLARATGRPVKFVASSHEDLLSTSHRHPLVATLRTGVKRDGTIVAREAKIVFNSGAYGSLKPNADGMLNGADHAGGPYEIPNVHIEAFAVYTNTPPSGYMRAPGHAQVLFAVEGHMDLVARELGIDPLEFRLLNISPSPSPFPGARDIPQRVLQSAADAIGWTAPKPPHVGRGLAIAVRGTGIGEGTSDLTLNPDGTITVLTSMPDNGTGALTVVAQVVAEAFGLSIDRVRLVRADTDALPIDVGAGASRMTNVAGHAALAASDELKAQLAPLAATMLGADAVAWDRTGWRAGDGRFASVEDLATEMIKPGDPAAHVQVTLAQERSPDRGYGVQAAEVEVDAETGQVRVRKFVSAQDTGTVINPLGHQGQIDGGAVTGIGFALSEELVLEDGRVANAHLGEYKLPTPRDIPGLVTVNIPSTGPGPFSAKAIGELPSVPGAAAIANAVADAIGAPIYRLPIRSEQVLETLKEKD